MFPHVLTNPIRSTYRTHFAYTIYPSARGKIISLNTQSHLDTITDIIYPFSNGLAQPNISIRELALLAQRTRTLTTCQEFSQDSLNQDFELFSSTTQNVNQQHGSSTPLPMTGATFTKKKALDDRYGAESMIPSTKNQEPWLDWYHASTAQNLHILPVVKAKNKLSISDSGYGSVDHTDRHGIETGSSAQPDMASSPKNQVSEYCGICCEESEKRRYFSNNADRRLAF